MKKTLLVLSLVLIAGALALVWLFTGSDPASEPTVVAPRGATPPPAKVGVEEVAILPKPSEEDPNAERKSVGDVAGNSGRVAELLADATWVDVDVRLPANTPTDEKLTLFAVVFAPDKFADDAAVENGLALYKQMTQESGFGFGGRIAAMTPPNVALAEELPCEATSVGHFRAPFPKGSKKGLLRLDARYSYVAEFPSIELPSKSVTVEPVLGAWFTGRMRLPNNLPGDVDPNALEPFDVNLNGWKMSADAEHHGELVKVEDRLDFEIGGLRPGMTYFLQGTSPQFVAFTDMQLTPRAGEHLERQYDLRIGAFVSGRVVDEAGAGVANANISVDAKRARRFFGGMNDRGSKSDAEGNFSLRAIDAGKVTIGASFDGFVEGKSDELDLVDGQRVENVTVSLSRGNVLAGRVLWPDGAPAVEARVDVIERDTKNARRGWNDWSQHNAKTDAEGRFSLSGLKASTVSVTVKCDLAQKQGDKSPGTWSARRDDVQLGVELSLTLEAPHEVNGRVVDDLGEPLAKFFINVDSSDDGRSSSTMRMPFEAPDGTFKLMLAAGTHKLTAQAEAHGGSDEQSVTVPGDSQPLTFTLPRAASITGVVLDPAGSPIAGASIEVDSNGSGRGMRMPRLPGSSDENTSDAQGRFTLKEVAPGSVTLTATKKDFAPSEALALEVIAGEPIADAQLRLRMGGRLEGEIYAASGAPDAGRQIMVGSFMGGGGSMDGNATSDSAGHFVVEHIVPGKHNVVAVPKMDQIVANSEGDFDQAELMSSLKMTMVDIVEGQTAHVVLGAPPKAPVRLSGRVTQAGKPYSDGMVMAIADGKSMLDSLKMGKLDSNGRYAITLDAPGDYTLIIGQEMGDDHAAEFQETIPEQPEYQLDLAVPLGAIRGRVTSRDGSALPGVPVVLEAEGRGSIFAMDMGRSIETNEDGRFELKNLKPGTYTLRAGASRMDFLDEGKRAWGIGIRTGLVVEADRVLEGADLRLDAPGSIEGTVLTADGKPVAKAAVFVRDGEGRLLNPMSSCVTDGLGKFTFEGASVGTCSVSARSGNLSSRESAALHVVASQKSVVELRLEPATTLRISVEDEAGKTVRATLRVVDESGREFSNMFGGDMFEAMFTEGFSSTEQRVGPLPPGKYKVQATGPDGTSVTKPVTLNGQEERTLRIKLKD